MSDLSRKRHNSRNPNSQLNTFPQGKSSDQIVYKALGLIHVFVISRVPNKTIGLMKWLVKTIDKQLFPPNLVRNTEHISVLLSKWVQWLPSIRVQTDYQHKTQSHTFIDKHILLSFVFLISLHPMMKSQVSMSRILI